MARPFGATRQRLLVLLAEGGRQPVRLRDLEEPLGLRSHSTVFAQLQRLQRDGLVEKTPAGYRLAPGIAVGRNGYVGRMHATLS